MHSGVWFALGGALVLSYSAYHFASRNKSKACSLLKTQMISQEIKHQMLTACTSLAKNVATGLKNKSTNVPLEQLENYFRKEISTLYETKEEQILEKHDVPKDEYASGLIKHAGDALIDKNTKELFDMMERTVRGVPPDFTVHAELLQKFNPLQLKETYLEMCLHVLREVLRKLKYLVRADPSFDPKDGKCFRDAVKQMGLFSLKTQFLWAKGFDPVWGCPNEAIFKAIEIYKERDPAFQTSMLNVDKAYEVITRKVTNDPDSLNQDDIPRLIYKELNNQPEINSTVALNASAPSAARFPPMQNKPVQLPKIVKKKERTETEEDQELARIMMDELMKRPELLSTVEKPQSFLLRAEPVDNFVNNSELVNQAPIQPAEPAVVEPAVVEPAVVEPAVVEPAVAEPDVSITADIEHIAQPSALETEQEKYEKYLDSLDAAESIQTEKVYNSEYEKYLETTEEVKEIQIESILKSSAHGN